MNQVSLHAESLIGRSRDELPTPVLVLDLELLERNIQTLADWARGRVSVRPHVKVHKSPEIARRQIAAGASGVTAATVWEVLAMVDAGVESVLLANEVNDPAKAQLLAMAAARAEVIVAIDDPAGRANALGRRCGERRSPGGRYRG